MTMQYVFIPDASGLFGTISKGEFKSDFDGGMMPRRNRFLVVFSISSHKIDGLQYGMKMGRVFCV